eukprot:COSAG02_NODE_1042_length_15026_cov_14.034233_1_plen_78_part_00
MCDLREVVFDQTRFRLLCLWYYVGEGTVSLEDRGACMTSLSVQPDSGPDSTEVLRTMSRNGEWSVTNPAEYEYEFVS